MGLRRNKETLWILESDLKRKMWIKYFLNRFLFNSITKHSLSNTQLKLLASVKNQKMKSYRSITFLNNRCLRTGRGYSINSSYKLSRFALRDTYNKLLIPGLRRASW